MDYKESDHESEDEEMYEEASPIEQRDRAREEMSKPIEQVKPLSFGMPPIKNPPVISKLNLGAVSQVPRDITEDEEMK